MHQGTRRNPAVELDPLAFGCVQLGRSPTIDRPGQYCGGTTCAMNEAAAAITQARDCAQEAGTLGATIGGYCPRIQTQTQPGGDMYAGEFCDWVSTSTMGGGTAQPKDYMGEGWYRFTGAAGTRLFDVALDGTGVDIASCGSSNCPCSGKPMTLERGGHPSVEDGEVERTLGPWPGVGISFKIKIINCPAGYYVYHLPGAPICDMSFCGGGEAEPDANGFSPPEWRTAAQVAGR